MSKPALASFWNIFDEVYVKPFDDTDRDALLEIASLIVTVAAKRKSAMDGWASKVGI